jgi:hypothetical protein
MTHTIEREKVGKQEGGRRNTERKANTRTCYRTRGTRSSPRKGSSDNAFSEVVDVETFGLEDLAGVSLGGIGRVAPVQDSLRRKAWIKLACQPFS